MVKNVSVAIPEGKSRTISVDDDIFDDVYIESCTRVLEMLAKESNLKMSPVMTCCLVESSDISDIVSVNTYKVLLNASLYKQAEYLRQHLIANMKIDWNDEPLIIK